MSGVVGGFDPGGEGEGGIGGEGGDLGIAAAAGGQAAVKFAGSGPERGTGERGILVGAKTVIGGRRAVRSVAIVIEVVEILEVGRGGGTVDRRKIQ